jgi:hypothetical protein
MNVGTLRCCKFFANIEEHSSHSACECRHYKAYSVCNIPSNVITLKELKGKTQSRGLEKFGRQRAICFLKKGTIHGAINIFLRNKTFFCQDRNLISLIYNFLKSHKISAI